jgi:hypothetical protein
MRNLARIFLGKTRFGEDRRSADAARSKRQRNVRENLRVSKQDSKQHDAKQRDSKRHLLITNSQQDLVGVVGMGGATKKLKHAMPTSTQISEGAFLEARSVHDVPRPTESGVFVTSSRAIDVVGDVMALDVSARRPEGVDTRAIEEVTLIVYGWENVQPGTLSWVFPSLRSALAAVRAMRNAVRWAVLNGIEADEDVESARENGRVLVEVS